MSDARAIAVVGVGAIMPDAPSAPAFWQNIKSGRYSISEVPRERWDPDLYYDPDPRAPDKTYSKIGAWVRNFHFEPLKWGIPIPPSVLAVMDNVQKWAIAAAREALLDYGYPERPLDPTRVAVILGNSMAGENQYNTSLRVRLPEYLEALRELDAFRDLPPEVQRALLEGVAKKMRAKLPPITEDTMPGELANIIAGRVANVFNFSGANFVTDAACASSLAALQAAVEGLNNYQFDAVLTGGVDGNMSIDAFVKFSKIGALSPDGSRPFADGANGFVMGEGAAVFLLKRLADAERDGDKIYAVIRGVGGSSDGRGKGITAPNPTGQQRAIERAWKNAGLSPATATLIEAHGTSTRVGDVVEINSLNAVFAPFELPVASIAIGSVKSNIGHLKSAAGAAGLLKVIYALHERVLPPSVNFIRPNPEIDFSRLPFYVNTELRPWERPAGEIRRAGVSSFGFGGTNFHAVLEEYVPGLLTSERRVFPAVATAQAERVAESDAAIPVHAHAGEPLSPYRGLFFASAESPAGLKAYLREVLEQARSGRLPPSRIPSEDEIRRPERLALDYTDGTDLIKRLEKALAALEEDLPTTWQVLAGQGIFRGRGQPGKVAFLFPGQGSQYVNMLRDLYEMEPVVAGTFREADAVMAPLLGRPLSDYIFVEGDEARLKQAEEDLRNTVITQPAMLTANVALLRLLEKYGFRPDMTIGHSLGEYAALVAAGALPFGEALEIVSARGREMSKVSMADNGCMAAVSAPIDEIQRILDTVAGYVVIANLNSPVQSVIGGATPAVEAAIAALRAAGYQAVKIPVSHAFHTQIVAPASEPLRQVIARMHLNMPRIPVISNVTGEFYPADREAMLDLLARQVASPVQFIRGMQTLYAHGARIFVEVGPKRVLTGLASDIFKGQVQDVLLLATNHPRKGGPASFNEALCGLYAAGMQPQGLSSTPAERVVEIAAPQSVAPAPAPEVKAPQAAPAVITRDGFLPLTGSVVISGAGLGLPGRQRPVFDDSNIERILRGEILIEPLPLEVRHSLLQRRVVRLIKSDNGAEVQPVEDLEQTVKLAGQRGLFDLAEDFGVPAERVEALDISTQLAIAAGIEALRDAGIPLVMHYRQTSVGSYLPDRWRLPQALADETGVIFASAFPGLAEMARELEHYHLYQTLRHQWEELRALLALAGEDDTPLSRRLRERIADLEAQMASTDYHLDRRLVFRVLTMGHSQFAEYIGARGPNTHVNAACASTTHALALAEDWIRNGRCRRVIVVAGDDVTSNPLMSWIGASLMASGAATIEGDLRHAVLPFDRRRNGMIMGMGAAALVVEAEDAVRERGMRGICEILATDIANSAYHGTRLDVTHVSEIMERLVSTAERRFGIRREAIAPQTVFVSHETYTPARGGSASAEIRALRHVFGEQASKVVIANTKGFTGHAMGVGIEDVVAVKALEYGRVPPIANIDNGFEPDPELGDLNLSRGGEYPVRYALRLGAGFGSQIAMVLLRRVAGVGERVNPQVYDRWLADLAGYDTAELEVVKRTLRIRHAGPPVRPPLRSRWQYGQGPTLWAGEPALEAASTVARQEQPAVEQVPAPGAGTAAQQPLSGEVSQHPVIDEEQVVEFLLNLVSEKTGYPKEMLDLDLDLEADLGIDTVKQAELFAAVREHFNIPRREDLRLVDYNTLRKVIGFVRESLATAPSEIIVSAVASTAATAAASSPAPAPSAPPATSAPLPDEESIRAFLVSLVSEKTGYPADMLDLDLDLEADLGIDTVKQAELFAAVREHYGIPRREDLRLVDYNTLRKVIGFVRESLQGAVQEPQPPAVAAKPADVGPEVLELASERVGYPVDKPPIKVEDNGAAHHEEGSKARSVGMPDEASIQEFLVSLVSEKTGYPKEMLDLDLDLEADLGIDTVKQAELFAAVREHYGIPRREDLRLVDYNTLRKVIGFVQESLQLTVPPSPAEAQAPSEVTAAAEDVFPSEGIIRRRVPRPVLRPQAADCQPSGIQVGPETRVVIVADKGGVGDSLARRLRARKAQVLLLPAEDAQRVVLEVQRWASETPPSGLFFLPALDEEPSLADMQPETWQALLERHAHLLFDLLQILQGEPFLISATRLDGLHGFSGEGLAAPLGGAVSGLTKAVAWERANALVKVVDFSAEAGASEIAAQLVEELLYDPGVVEVGRRDGLRYGITLIETSAAPEQHVELGPKPVFLVTGGSGGITQAVVRHLARVTRGTFYLVARSPLPDPQDPDLLLLQRDRGALRQNLLKRLAERGERPSLAEVEAQLAALDRAAATLRLLEEARSWGAEIHFISADVTDAQAMDRVVQEIAQREGRLDGVIHAAGVERSRRLESKPKGEFAQILAVKATGFFNLYKSLERYTLWPKALVCFTSIAGRFGNAGQVDYCAGNDLLAKMMLALRTHPAGIYTLALDWGAWAEVGMASRGHVPELMRRAGIDLMKPEEAAPWVYRELTNRSQDAEVVLAGSLGLLTLARRPDDGLNLVRLNEALRSRAHPMLGTLTEYSPWRGATVEVELDPQTLPFLRDHALNNIPLLPAVMGLEGFAALTQRLLAAASGREAWRVVGFSDVEFQAPLKFYRLQPRRFAMRIRVVYEKAAWVALAVLESQMQRPGRDAETVEHFRARVHVQPASVADAMPRVALPVAGEGHAVDRQALYRLFFHGPAFQVLDSVALEPRRALGRLNPERPPLAEASLETMPHLVELVLQTAAAWEVAQDGVLALPRAIKRLVYHGHPADERGTCWAEVIAAEVAGERAFNARVVNEAGEVLLEVEGYRTSPLPYAADAPLVAPFRAALSEEQRT